MSNITILNDNSLICFISIFLKKIAQINKQFYFKILQNKITRII